MSLFDSRPGRVSILLLLFWTGTLGVAYFGILAFMILVVPQYERAFLEQRVRLPYLTELVIAVSRGCVKYWYVAAVLIGGGYLFGGGLLGALRPSEKWERRLWLAWLFLAGTAAIFLFVAWFALQILPAMD